ncbi:MAG: hypothetical protein BAA04_12335 [Firmicutes bacterium ZCTH02-B6]|nr:MAG: hypothetical protein BAA04_12335 [Firmicutes bacterium ZCTH02-B6]
MAAGADLVTFSGDKLLGGPQAGIIVGRKDLVERCRRHPLARAVRVDKLTLAALQATLQHYLDGTVEQIPVYRMLAAAGEELQRRAERVRTRVLATIREDQVRGLFDLQVRSTVSTVGGGSLPGEGQPSAAVAVTVRAGQPPAAQRGDGPVERGCPRVSIEAVAAALRRQEPPIIGRIEDDVLLLDLRAVEPAQDDLLADGLARAMGAVACTS